MVVAVPQTQETLPVEKEKFDPLTPKPEKFDLSSYPYKDCLPTYPKVDYEPHVEFSIDDRALRADPEKKAFLGAATKVRNLTATIGTEIEGIDLRNLTPQQLDEMTLLGAERGVLVFRNQAADIYKLLEIAEYYGPLHIHSTTGVPTDPALKGVHIVWNDGSKRSDWLANRGVSWHSDQSYEMNTMGFTSLKVVTAPSAGGDTVWASAQALLSTFSPNFIAYLETLSALHSSDHQKQRALNAGTHIRRPQTDAIHPVVRVHPVTGIKGLYVNPSYTRRIVGVPEHESDAILNMIWAQLKGAEDLKVRVHWDDNTVVFWDNRICYHTATGDYFPERRHGLRATPMAERPMSVEQYEAKTGKKAKDWYEERMAKFGIDVAEERQLSANAKKLSLKDGD